MALTDGLTVTQLIARTSLSKSGLNVDIAMGTSLTDQFREQLHRWIDANQRKRFILLFKASRDGCSAQTFHTLCNNKGPTITVLYNTNGSVYGGYTSASWHSNNTYTTDDKAFLFRLRHNGTCQPQKFSKLPSTDSGIYGHSNYGPTFGGNNGHDLRTFTGAVNKSGNVLPLNGTTNFGSYYDMQGQSCSSVMNGHMQVLDLEVYSVEGNLQEYVSKLKMLQRPWVRNIEWNPRQKNKSQTSSLSRNPTAMTFSTGGRMWLRFVSLIYFCVQFLKELKESIETYKPLPGLGLQQTRILMVGQVGSGKSSFFNTINSIFRGHISGQANAGSAEHSLTTTYRMYQIRDGYAGRPLNFRLCDTRGLEEDQGLDDHEICYLLDGHVPDRFQFNPAVPLSPEVMGFVKGPGLGDRIHCVAFVVDSSTVDVISEKVLERIKNMQTKMNQRSIPQVVLLTKIDRICELVTDEISDVFVSPTVKECVDRVAMVMGLPRSHILPVKNYECEVELDQDVNILSLLCLRQVLHFSDDYLYNQLDQIEAEKIAQTQMKE
ncbi:interferon-induced protein 44-like [Argopecten irradians]|uniref:interferon-induced protein 44-like n=1 Tax=Argopecten irradians TaxID=31199 RepID=UPI00372444B7